MKFIAPNAYWVTTELSTSKVMSQFSLFEAEFIYEYRRGDEFLICDLMGASRFFTYIIEDLK